MNWEIQNVTPKEPLETGLEKPQKGGGKTPHQRAQEAHNRLYQAAQRFDKLMEEYNKNSWVWGVLWWWMVSVWIMAMEVFGSDMTMAFIGRVNQGGKIAVARTLIGVRKDYKSIERLFRTRFGNRPRHQKMLYKIALFTGMLWVTGQSDPLSYTARALVMAWITRDVQATIYTMVHGAAAMTPFDWTAYNELIPAISEAAGTLSWEIMAGLKVVSAVGALAVIRWLRAEASGRQLTGVQYNTMLSRHNEAALQFGKSIALQKAMKEHIDKLEAELGDKPTAEQINQWKEGVKAWAADKAQITELKTQLGALQFELDTRPPKGDEPEKVQNLLITIQQLHNKIAELNEAIADRLRSEPTAAPPAKPSRSVVREPDKFDGAKPQYYWIWEKAVRGKVEADGEYYFPNNNVLWEWLCGTVSKNVAIQVRMTHWTKFAIDEDVTMGNTPAALNTKAVLEGFFKTVFRHFGNPALFITLNDDYQKCTQGSRTFQAFYQELSLLATQLGLDMTSEEFKGRLQHNLAGYLRELTINKRYKTVEEAVDDMQMIDTEYRIIKGMKTGRRSERTEENPEIPTVKQLQKEVAALKASKESTQEPTEAKKFKKKNKTVKAPGSIDEPCPHGDQCRFKDKGTCWRQH